MMGLSSLPGTRGFVLICWATPLCSYYLLGCKRYLLSSNCKSSANQGLGIKW